MLGSTHESRVMDRFYPGNDCPDVVSKGFPFMSRLVVDVYDLSKMYGPKTKLDYTIQVS